MKVICGVTFFVALAVSSPAFAGFGAIAYNSATGASSEAHGYSSRAEAEEAALRACGGGCTIMNWEENSCIALATNSSGAWGEGHGYATQAEAVNEAISVCGGPNCTDKEWACR